MKKLKLLFLLALVASITIVSCTKDDDKDEPTVEPTGNNIQVSVEDFPEFLAGTVSKSWSANSFTLAGSTQECRLDDTFTFNLDNTYSYHGGDILCGDEDDEVNKSGTWMLDENGESITFDQGTDNEFTAEISAAGDNDLVLTGSYFLMPVVGNYSF